MFAEQKPDIRQPIDLTDNTDDDNALPQRKKQKTGDMPNNQLELMRTARLKEVGFSEDDIASMASGSIKENHNPQVLLHDLYQDIETLMGEYSVPLEQLQLEVDTKSNIQDKVAIIKNMVSCYHGSHSDVLARLNTQSMQRGEIVNELQVTFKLSAQHIKQITASVSKLNEVAQLQAVLIHCMTIDRHGFRPSQFLKKGENVHSSLQTICNNITYLLHIIPSSTFSKVFLQDNSMADSLNEVADDVRLLEETYCFTQEQLCEFIQSDQFKNGILKQTLSYCELLEKYQLTAVSFIDEGGDTLATIKRIATMISDLEKMNMLSPLIRRIVDLYYTDPDMYLRVKKIYVLFRSCGISDEEVMKILYLRDPSENIKIFLKKVKMLRDQYDLTIENIKHITQSDSGKTSALFNLTERLNIINQCGLDANTLILKDKNLLNDIKSISTHIKMLVKTYGFSPKQVSTIMSLENCSNRLRETVSYCESLIKCKIPLAKIIHNTADVFSSLRIAYENILYIQIHYSDGEDILFREHMRKLTRFGGHVSDRLSEAVRYFKLLGNYELQPTKLVSTGRDILSQYRNIERYIRQLENKFSVPSDAVKEILALEGKKVSSHLKKTLAYFKTLSDHGYDPASLLGRGDHILTPVITICDCIIKLNESIVANADIQDHREEEVQTEQEISEKQLYEVDDEILTCIWDDVDNSQVSYESSPSSFFQDVGENTSNVISTASTINSVETDAANFDIDLSPEEMMDLLNTVDYSDFININAV